jgi:hypothetical protein
MNLLVARTEVIARQLISAANLPRDQWLARSVGGALLGHQLDVVLWLVDEPSDRDPTYEMYQGYRNHAITKLKPGGQFFESELPL